ncbi:Uncharacterized conserved protein, contains ParB-like and HNH nuclease domains [Anaerocolumna jejuensis DSM 15929]|uniref:Uncharacterized conserved protein, contains ParB-like and HNH nuclease domains n=1 Tax=Anaerocolumna jejuensis DSM 15929 TaxID=1121322 RepID=A0A1M6Y9F4_9FIRM|nr:DUF262 domain-containing protein [Anaerocolumna jejuensis]SHL14926.1 Uncharacterized conserved protein, contains ParB-like and HNH nuclease domains [Anaerocolumna jejuensis DSM 15929]
MNGIRLKTLNELSLHSFYIPAYQRGYRWTVQEVRDLLNDIHEFIPREINDTEDKTWYCLQPIVVKNRSENEYEVIDGQQRLTTVYLVLYYLNQDFIEKKRDKLFYIDYQTRQDSKIFLQNPENENDSCIDFFYMHEAYTTIEKWFYEKEEDSSFDKNNYRSKLKFHTKVIWYETTEDNPITVFTRLNIGKISLTNAELIKALFLNSSNFGSSNADSMRLRQIEIANEWDSIEISLQNNKLWYFLSDAQKDDNRIEYIFDLMNDSNDTDPYSTFRFFNAKLAGKTEDDMKKYWEEIQSYYQRFNEWFSERELYHKIGFILTAKIAKVKELYNKSSALRKSEFVSYIDAMIRNHYKNENLFDLDYENKSTRSVLLLYNILTMLQNEHDSSYFPFDDFKLNKWNIEHIASLKDSSTIPMINRKEWLSDVKSYIDKEQKESIKLIKQLDGMLVNETYANEDEFTSLFDKVTVHFNQYMSEFENVDGISNLALLDEKTNKGYKNAVFPLKRKCIIELDKTGGFVPICTKNVFLKYFSDYPPKISFWTQDDREKYELDLVRVLTNYLEVNK